MQQDQIALGYPTGTLYKFSDRSNDVYHAPPPHGQNNFRRLASMLPNRTNSYSKEPMLSTNALGELLLA